jgi:hypothetical protein
MNKKKPNFRCAVRQQFWEVPVILFLLFVAVRVESSPVVAVGVMGLIAWPLRVLRRLGS